ncbi:response regulator transcription factor [Plantactinospora alkalitolerans]|uniref:response regulator transcription factor n=1 Tax=Plantactinospora alkalitolerans TaxID=2789879 RepID=UPI002B215AE9|nr:response regulator transcription factor [Plantactinospora alkalitolerans]
MDDNVITAVVIDDHEVIPVGIRVWCDEAKPPIRIVDHATKISAAWTGPGAQAHVVILDLGLQHGRQAFNELRRLNESRRHVVVFTQDASSKTAIKCIDLGALAYVTKNEGPQHLVAAIRAAAQGLSYTPPSLSGAIAADDDPNRPQLPPREIDALRAWCGSRSKSMAARSLGISVSTLETYIERARVRYASAGRPAPTKAALMARAIEDGLMGIEDLSANTSELDTKRIGAPDKPA